MLSRPVRTVVGGVTWCALTAASFALAAGQERATGGARYVRLAEVRALVQELRASAPPGLPSTSGPQAEAQWLTWVTGRDRAIRARLAQGDEDTLVNWILLGTSFTSRPPARLDGSQGTDDRAIARLIDLMGARLEDGMRAIANPGGDERRLFARRLLENRGFKPATAAGQAAARDYLVRAIQRVIDEANTPSRAVDVRRSGPTSEFSDRGLSLDTSLAPNFALFESLEALRMRGLLRPGQVRRVAIVGAGLDFADKNTGFDFYPVQTVQPFAVLDAVRRLQLAPASGPIAIVAFDISPRVVDHINRIRSAGSEYTVRLPIARGRAWTPQFRQYWQTFGDQVGTSVTASAPPAVARDVDMRAVRLSRASVATLSAADANVVLQRVGGPPFDLVIATNVLLYYDTFEQGLALANIEAMLADGGVLLTNTVLPAPASLRIRRVGSKRTLYTTDQTGDEIVWYLAGR